MEHSFSQVAWKQKGRHKVSEEHRERGRTGESLGPHGIKGLLEELGTQRRRVGKLI